MFLVCGEAEEAVGYIIGQTKAQSGAKKTGILCFDEYIDVIGNNIDNNDCSILSMGRKGSAKEQAKNLFGCLNAFDSLGVDVIYSLMPDRNEIGAAVYNRMLKAAGNKIVNN